MENPRRTGATHTDVVRRTISDIRSPTGRKKTGRFELRARRSDHGPSISRVRLVCPSEDRPRSRPGYHCPQVTVQRFCRGRALFLRSRPFCSICMTCPRWKAHATIRPTIQCILILLLLYRLCTPCSSLLSQVQLESADLEMPQAQRNHQASLALLVLHRSLRGQGLFEDVDPLRRLDLDSGAARFSFSFTSSKVRRPTCAIPPSPDRRTTRAFAARST